MQFAIKDIVKDNKAHFSFYRSGNMFYTVTVNGSSGTTTDSVPVTVTVQ